LHALAAGAIFSITYPASESKTYRPTALYLPALPPKRQPKVTVPRKIAVTYPVAPKTMPPLPLPSKLVAEAATPVLAPEARAAIPEAPAAAVLNTLEPSPIPPPARLRIEVQTGAFETAAPGATALPPAARIQAAQFGSIGRSELRPERAKVGGNASFGDAAAQSASTANRGVSSALFETAAAAPAVHRAASAATVSEPIEILAKPKPLYTEEARRLGIQGEVVLEVLFRATAQISVLRVVRGLGHGLDASAERAALGIRFHPAAAGGRPIDSVATVKIEFQLAD
jgi:TonB family protein